MNLKSVILSILLIISFFSYSQKIGFHLGVNSSNLLDNDEFSSQDSNYKNVLGLDVGIDIKLKIKKNLFILTGLSFYQNGFKEDEEIFDNGSNFASNARLNYIRFPINLLLETNKKNNFNFGVKSGVYFSKILNKEYFIDTDVFEITAEDLYKNFDYGLNFGGLININKFTISLNYNLGLNNIAIGEIRLTSDRVKNRNWNLNLIYFVN